MATSPKAQVTDFSRDVLGRYVCNGLDEALRSTDKNGRRPDGSSQNDARAFDIIIVGGGTFGSTLAQHLFFLDQAHSHRILVLEGGPFVVPEHVQNLPMLGLNVPGETSIKDLRDAGNYGPDKPMQEVWGLAWHSGTKFPGLAYCVGGRSVYWGGWSPRLLDAEMNRWPATVVNDLKNTYFAQASKQMGVDETNDFIFGPLHEALRQQLFTGINAGKVTDAIPLAQLPLVFDVPRRAAMAMAAGSAVDIAQTTVSSAAAAVPLDIWKLEAPLAVQSRTRSGFFPFNKFSAAPLLMKAARAAWSEAGGDDVKKRLMVVPNCHVKRLVTGRTQGGLNVIGIDTSQGYVPVESAAPVIIALGTVESTRLVLLALQGEPNFGLVGRNLMVHLRSNLTIRIPREALATLNLSALDPTVKGHASALFVKGRHPVDGTVRHFHLQITAAGLGAMGTDSEADLFKKVPDIDTFEAFQAVSESHVVITIRGIGEMGSQNSSNHITLDAEPDEFGVPRAFVSIAPTSQDIALWDAMDKASDEVAKVFAGGKPFEVFTPKGIVKVTAADDLRAFVPYTDRNDPNNPGRRDGLGTTFHEAGTMWMGDGGPGTSVTDSDGRLNELANAYVAGPALFPTIGSPNPVLTGVALARRLGDRLVPPPTPYQPEDGFTPLFDGFTTNNWRMSTIKNQPGKDNPGEFIIADGALESLPGSDIGLFWCTIPTPPDFILKLDWLRWEDWDNSGVFVRFPHPDSKGYNNTAYVGVRFGFEVQIDEFGAPDGAGIHKTGAMYREDGRTDNEVLTLQPARPVGQWNQYEIRVQKQTYTIFLNGQQVCLFNNPYPGRGLPSAPNAPTFIGLQTHTGRVAFRNIRIKKL